MTQELIKEFLTASTQKFEENTKKLITCLNELDETDTWKRPNKNSNSIGNLILHLCGNIRQYVISSLGHLPDVRERDKEFSAKDGYSKQELINKLKDTVDEAVNIIRNITVEELLRKRQVQGYFHSGIHTVVHVTEHYSYHTGQIIFWTKLLKNKDLGFYAGINLNLRNNQ
jgi:uncharacterized damage-inducible protein DinB